MREFLCLLVAVSLAFGSGEVDYVDCGRYNITQFPCCGCSNDGFMVRINCGVEKTIEIEIAWARIHIHCKEMETLRQCAELIPEIYFNENKTIEDVAIFKPPRISSDDIHITSAMFLNKLNNTNMTVPEVITKRYFISGLLLNGAGSFYTWAFTHTTRETTWIQWYKSKEISTQRLNYESIRNSSENLEVNEIASIPYDGLALLSHLKHIIFSNNINLQLTSSILQSWQELETLKLLDNIITEFVTNDTFSTFNNLATVILINNTFKEIPDMLFHQNKMLQTVILSHNDVTNAKLPKMFLANLPELTEVDLSYSSLGEVLSDAFRNSTRIENIRLNNNKLETLPWNVFNDLVVLKQLDLSCNKIKSLPDSIFEKLTSLEVLNMNKNLIAVMHITTFLSLHNLASLLMSQNKLTIFCRYGFSSTSFFDLKTIDLSYNQLDFLSGSPFKELETLVKFNISHNNISRGDIFWSKSMALRSLDISYNNIQSIEFDNIHSESLIKSKDIVIDLTHNNISLLNEFTYHQLDPIKGSSDRRLVLLGNNPIICDCEVYGFVKYLKERRGTQRSIVNLLAEDVQCAGPKDKKNIQLVDLNEDELTCFLNEENWCPEDCMCQFRPSDQSIIVHCEGSSIEHIKGLPGKIHISQNVQNVNIESYEVHLENNSLINLPSLDDYVTKLYLKGNCFADLSVAAIPKNITVLDIRGNLLADMTKETFEGIFNKTKLRQVFYSDNPLNCDCSNLDVISVIQRNHVKIADYTSVKCADGRKISELAMVTLCGAAPSSHLAAAIVNGIIAGISLIAAGVLYYKIRLITRGQTTERYPMLYRQDHQSN